MKKILLVLIPIIFFGLWSCTSNEKILVEKEVTFSIASPAQSGNNGGRIAVIPEPKSVLVTIKDSDGTIVTDRKELILYKFGENFLSLPLTLKTSGASKYLLTEFMVMSADNKVTYATPKEGSKLARLVSDPLDIEFIVVKDIITTVTPEVLALDENTSPADYGYGQFGFNVVKTINTVFSAFIKGANNGELTNAHIKIEGLKDSTSQPSLALWVYETELEAKANTLDLKEALFYRITASKDDYQLWERTVALQQGDKVEILFTQANKLVDVYMAGMEDKKAVYWKNGVAVPLSYEVNSVAKGIFYSNGDVYATGYVIATQNQNAFYWKNGEKIYLPQIGDTYGLSVSNGDVYITGSIVDEATGYTKPAYWKNGNLTVLPTTSIYPSGYALDIAFSGENVYLSGRIDGVGTSNKFGNAALWKNGELIQLSNPSSGYVQSVAHSLKVSGGHVHITGYSSKLGNATSRPTVAVYWKDGQPIILGSELDFSYSEGLEIVNDDVYVVGFESHVGTGWQGKYWKNNQEIIIDGDVNVNLYAISWIDNNVYVAGDYRKIPLPGVLTPPAVASYWVNGTRVQCGTGQHPSFAFSMQVVPK